MTTTTTRTIDDRCRAIGRQVIALTRNPAEWSPDDLYWLTRLEHLIESARDEAVLGLRDSGHTDSDIAAAMGVTRQAVSKRWPGGGRYVGAAGRYRSPRSADD